MSTEGTTGPLGWVLDRARGLGEWFSEWSLKYIPDPYTIAILLTLVTFLGALVLEIGADGAAPAAGVKTVFDAWYDGLWSLLPFMATLSVLLMTGDAVAKSPAVTRVLERIAAFPSSRFVAVWFTTFVAMTTALISWALGLIVGAIMAKRVAFEMRQQGITIHYPLLVAAGYTGLMIFHSGLTSSASLIMADPSLIPSTFPDYARQAIPLTETIGSPITITNVILYLVAIPPLMAAMHPASDVRELPAEVRSEVKEVVTRSEEGLEDAGEVVPEPVAMKTTKTTLADRLNNSLWVGGIIAVFPAYYVVNAWVLQPGGLSNLTLNSINALFLLAAILLWRSPIRLVAQMKDSVSNISGIIFQFPFYAGIAGLLTGTGVAGTITGFFAQFATPVTWPVIGVVISAVVNVFIPSGGGQWVAQGPILMETTRELGMPLSYAVIIEILGDPLTNMIQPFWAIPLLAIANLRARDIIGYTVVAMLAGFAITAVVVTLMMGVWGL